MTPTKASPYIPSLTSPTQPVSRGTGPKDRVDSWRLLVPLLLVSVALAGCVAPTPDPGADDPSDDGSDDDPGQGEPARWQDRSIPMHELTPVEAGKRYTDGNCEGEGSVELGATPMAPEDIGVLYPYGTTVFDHVTPIDHQYLYPEDFESDPDSYPVYAPANGTVFYIDNVADPDAAYGDYEIRYTYSCTFFVWYSLMTNISDRLQTAFDREATADGRASVDVPVEEGEQVGRIGGVTLDYAVLDTTRPLDGFISPGLYESEATKIFTAPPSDYYSDDVRDALGSLNPRTADPADGRIDWDTPGTLQGNWFVEGTGGYRGTAAPDEPPTRYWKTHLSIHPDPFDPNGTIVSAGDFGGEPLQMLVHGDAPHPTDVGPDDGPVAYTLGAFEYITPDGDSWDRLTYRGNLTIRAGGQVDGCGLFEVLEGERLRAEMFPGAGCDEVDGFSDNARVYER